MRNILLLLLSTLFTLTSSLFAFTLERGPYLTNPSTTSIAVNFVMKDATAKEYSIELSLKGKVVKSVKTTPYSVDSNKTLYYANLTNLIPNTTYSYVIVSSDKQRSKAITFTTFESGNKEYTVFVNSDIHNRSSMLSHMMNYGKKANAALYCLLGDNVGNSIDNPYKDIMGGFLTDVSRSTLGKYPIIILRGNHEIRGKKAHLWSNFFPNENNRTYYSLRLGNTFYLCLDTADADSERVRNQLYPVEREWIKQQLESDACKTATFRVAMIHYPTHAMNEKIVNLSSGQLLGNLLMSTDKEKRFHLMLAGHRHRYIRTDAGSEVFKVNSCVFKGSLPGKPGKDFPYTLVLLDSRGNEGVEYNFVLVKNTKDKLIVQSMDHRNNKLDEFSIAPDGKVTDLMKVAVFPAEKQ
jgi:predicted phosphodiesterase